MNIVFIGHHLPCIHIVRPHHIQDGKCALLEIFVQNRENQLYAAVQVARHPVGGTHEDPRISAVLKAEDPAVLQKLPDDGNDCDVLGHADKTRDEAADAAHDQMDRDAGPAGVIEQIDDSGVDERIDLGSDAGRKSLLRVFGLAADERLKGIAHTVRCHDHFAEHRRTGVAGQEVEQP